MAVFTPALANTYEQMFQSIVIDPNKYTEIDGTINIIAAHQAEYTTAGQQWNIPWYFIGIIHSLECSSSFHEHLHNGDPLTARTVHVPAGRPVADPAAGPGNPYSWQESAVDALAYDGFNTWTDWSIGGMLYSFEKYNGFGYRAHGINTPYLWSYSNFYTSGKYTDDGQYDPNAVSDQCGAVVLLSRMVQNQIVSNIPPSPPSPIATAGAQVQYNPGPYDATTYSAAAAQLQTLITAAGIPLTSDGFAGENTSNAYQQLTGSYLSGDPRGN